MEILLYIVMLILGLIGSFFSGLLGIGGAIINYPLLLYVPDWLGVAHFNPLEVSSISMFQVLFASLAGVVAFRKRNDSNVIHNSLSDVHGNKHIIWKFAWRACIKIFAKFHD